MDVFAWVNDLTERLDEEDPQLAYEIANLADWACSGHRDRLEGALPRIVAEARRRDLPWLEVYARHWGLQSSVVRHYEVERGLGEAVSAMERASREDVRDCPQSICTVQDLCIAYGLVDGPGFAAEREQAARETLTRIDARWPCHRCIHEELAQALLDSGRPAEARAHLEQELSHEQRREAPTYVLALLAEGRAAQAVIEARNLPLQDRGELGRLGKAISLARALALDGQLSESVAALPAWSARLADACEHHQSYVDALALLLDEGALEPTVEHTQQVTHIVHTLRERGARRHAVRVALRWAEHLLHGPLPSARLVLAFLDHVEPLLPALRGSFGDLERHAELRARAEAVRAEPWASDVGTSREILDERMQGGTLRMEEAEATAEALPEHTELVTMVAQHWARRGWPEISRRWYQHALTATPAAPEALVPWLGHLTATADWDGLEHALAHLPESDALVLHRHWHGAALAEARGDEDGAGRLLREMIDRWGPDCGYAVFRRAAQLERSAERVDEALAVWARAVELNPEWKNARWERIELASMRQDWRIVRDEAVALELPVEPGNEPVEERWGRIRLRLPDHDHPVQAVRTGPATARLLWITCPRVPERFHELWVFDAAPIDESDGIQTYRAHCWLEEGRHASFTVDGVRLPDPLRERLEAVVEDQGGELHFYSSEAYRIRDPDPEAPHGVCDAQFLKVAIPEDRFDGPRLVACLQELAQEVDGPLVWLELAQRVQGGAVHAVQLATAKAWGMV